jgi:hypothetical protein
VIYNIFFVLALLASRIQLRIEHFINNEICLDARDSHLAQCKNVENDAVFGLAEADPCKHVFLSSENVAGGTIANLRPVHATLYLPLFLDKT